MPAIHVENPVYFASIAGGRANRLLAKPISMSIKPYRDFIGGIAAAITLSLLAAALVTVTGPSLGARFAGAGSQMAER